MEFGGFAGDPSGVHGRIGRQFPGEYAEALEFFTAELEFLFLDFGEAFADGGVAVAEEHGADLLEGFHVFGAMGAGEGEFEGGLFEHMDRGVRELRLAGGGELEDLSGGFLGLR